MQNTKLRTKFVVLMAGIVIISLAVNIFWSMNTQRDQAEREMHEKAQVLAQQLDAVWEFMNINQDLINSDSDGSYNFKGLHCSVVGKSIGKIFTRETDYVVRYTNFNPRKNVDSPDPFEAEALNSFNANRNMAEYYSISEYNGEQVFRYVKPMRIDESCLECHGDPAGEPDILGYPKEGWKIGDLGGALSIVMPIDLYQDALVSNITQEVIFFLSLIVACVAVIYVAVSRLVTGPLARFSIAVKEVEKGKLDVSLDDIKAEGEIGELAENFSSMAEQLRELYADLEGKVEFRTDQLHKANSILESQRGQLEQANVSLQKANELLQEENRYKSDFLAIMSHELRTPLTSILAFTEILERSENSEEDVITEIKNNGTILLNMINNILEMARLEAGKLELSLEPVELVDIVNTVENTLRPIADRKGVFLSSKVERDVPIILADYEKLRRIVENLAGNAIKFTLWGGKVDINVTLLTTENMVRIDVTDTGIGISEPELPYVFEKFRQGDTSVSREYNGSGLGLALVKELAEMHGGTVLANSEAGKGSVFSVFIPVKEVEGEDME